MRPFSPTSESNAPQLKGSKGPEATPGSEIDPTTVRKHRTFRRKNPQDIYDQYDDLFTHDETIDEQVAAYVNEYEHSGSDDGYPRRYPRRRGSQFHDAPRSPPRSVPTASTIYKNPKNAPESSLYVPQRLERSHDSVTPPQSKPPSVTDLGTLYPPFHLPPTPPLNMDYLIQDHLDMYLSNHDYISTIQENTVPPSRIPDSELEFIFPGPLLGEAQPPVSPPHHRLSLHFEDSLPEYKESHVKNEANKDVESSDNFRPFPDNSPLLVSQHSINIHPTDMFLTQPATSESVPINEVWDLHRVEEQNILILHGEEEVDEHNTAQGATQDASHNAAVGSSSMTPLIQTADVCALKDEFDVSALIESVEATPSLINTVKGSTPPDSALTTPFMNLQSPCIGPTTGTYDEMGEESEERDKPDATYLQLFRQFLKDSGENDVFIQRSDRFDALQMQRICAHRHKEYHVAPLTEVKKGKQVASASKKIKKQQQVADEMMTSIWAVMSFRWMTFGRLLVSPGHEMLAPKKITEGEVRVSNGALVDKARTRILDLGGTPIGMFFFFFFFSHDAKSWLIGCFSIGDWGWHCAYDYPRTQVYTVTGFDESSSAPAGVTLEEYEAPTNHSHIAVSHLWRLPFPENYFDVVSARSLFKSLKLSRNARPLSPIDSVSPASVDEYDLCLEECFRVLKPGGYLEFFIFDNDIVNAGPLGQKLATRFTDELEKNAYDPYPTRKWIQRLNTAGYGDIKRAWLFLPMAPQMKPKPPNKDEVYEVQQPPPPPQQRQRPNSIYDAVKEEVRKKLEAWEDSGTTKGSTENVAPVSGFLGNWVWGNWMLKTIAEAEEDSDWHSAFDEIGSVLDEGRDNQSGWRAMVGWARKPPAPKVTATRGSWAGRAFSTI